MPDTLTAPQRAIRVAAAQGMLELTATKAEEYVGPLSKFDDDV